MRSARVFAIAAIVLCLSACGGLDDDWASRADGICEKWEPQLLSLAPEDDPTEDAVEATRVLRKQLVELRQVPLPSGDTTPIKRMLASGSEAAIATGDYAGVLQARDWDGIGADGIDPNPAQFQADLDRYKAARLRWTAQAQKDAEAAGATRCAELNWMSW